MAPKQIIHLALILLTSSCEVVAQVASSPFDCAVIDKNHPAQFISFESASEATGVTLRIHNNSNCSIVVETDDRDPTILKKLPNGGSRIETVTGSQDGARLPLHYLIQERLRGKAPTPAYGWGDSVFIYEIKGGDSAIFIVPLVHFRRGKDVVVPFKYQWEGDGTIGKGSGGVVHLVYFLVENAPQSALRR